MRTSAEIMKEIEQEKGLAVARIADLHKKQVENRKHLEQVNEQYLMALADAADEAEIAVL